MVVMVVGLLYPLLVAKLYTPTISPVTKRSLAEAIYSTLIRPRVEYTGKNQTINLTSINAIIKARSSILLIENNCKGTIELKDIANIPSEYLVTIENGIPTITIIGYEARINLPCNTSKLVIDSRISYVELKLTGRNIPKQLNIHALGSIVQVIDEVNEQGVLSITLEDSLLELQGKYTRYGGERAIELRAISSIAYMVLLTGMDVKIRLVKENIGGITDITINDSYVYEKYYIDEGYYESLTRLHVGVTSIGSGVKIDIYRVKTSD